MLNGCDLNLISVFFQFTYCSDLRLGIIQLSRTKKPTMNLTIQKTESTVPLFSLKPGDCFAMQGSKFVILEPHPHLKIAIRGDIGLKAGISCVYASLPSDISPFMLFASDTDYDVIPLGKLVNSNAK